MGIISQALARRAIVTDDPMRARMLSAHHLEYSTLVYETGDIIVFSGSYKGVPIALASTGFGSSAILSFLREIKELGVMEVVYVGGCVSTTKQYGLRTVVLAAGSSKILLNRARDAAWQFEIPTTIQTVLPMDSINAEGDCIADSVTGALYEQARIDGIEALSILTVSENIKTGEKMEEHERRSRFYAASRLVFEMLAME